MIGRRLKAGGDKPLPYKGNAMEHIFLVSIDTISEWRVWIMPLLAMILLVLVIRETIKAVGDDIREWWEQETVMNDQRIRFLISFLVALVHRAGGSIRIDNLSEFSGRHIILSEKFDGDSVTLTTMEPGRN